MPVILSLCIPTFNRVRYLTELLSQLRNQISDKVFTPFVEIIVVDNASTDATHDYLSSLEFPGLRYQRNPRNIGGDANFIECVRQARGDYVWLLGDDELLEDKAVETVFHEAANRRHSLLILTDKNYNPNIGGRSTFENYAEFVSVAATKNPHLILAHTLISANVFRKEVFDQARARRMIATAYCHMHGLFGPLQKGGSVRIIYTDVLRIRDQRAPFKVEPPRLALKQGFYLLFIASACHNPKFRWYALRWIATALINTPRNEFFRISRLFKSMLQKKDV
jgi:glycosyltransferase involved in cell wall biosynthesis